MAKIKISEYIKTERFGINFTYVLFIIIGICIGVAIGALRESAKQAKQERNNIHSIGFLPMKAFEYELDELGLDIEDVKVPVIKVRGVYFAPDIFFSDENTRPIPVRDSVLVDTTKIQQ